MSEIRNNYAVAVVVFHFKEKVYRASSPKCRFKITSTNEWVSRKKKGLYFVYFNHYKHPKGEKVPKKRKSLVSSGMCLYNICISNWYIYVLPQRQYLRQIIKKKFKKIKRSERSDRMVP